MSLNNTKLKLQLHTLASDLSVLRVFSLLLVPCSLFCFHDYLLCLRMIILQFNGIFFTFYKTFKCFVLCWWSISYLICPLLKFLCFVISNQLLSFFYAYNFCCRCWISLSMSCLPGMNVVMCLRWAVAMVMTSVKTLCRICSSADFSWNFFICHHHKA